jgi:hypothetical protein
MYSLYGSSFTIPPVSAYFPYFEKNKWGLWDHLVLLLSLCLPVHLRVSLSSFNCLLIRLFTHYLPTMWLWACNVYFARQQLHLVALNGTLMDEMKGFGRKWSLHNLRYYGDIWLQRYLSSLRNLKKNHNY